MIEPNVKKEDRILRLEVLPGEKPKTTSGQTDNRLFTGETALHAVRTAPYDLWVLKYEHGVLPEPLKQKFTAFSKLFNFVDGYFRRRGFRIIKVED
jgi:hypothetical protein